MTEKTKQGKIKRDKEKKNERGLKLRGGRRRERRKGKGRKEGEGKGGRKGKGKEGKGRGDLGDETRRRFSLFSPCSSSSKNKIRFFPSGNHKG